MLKNPKFSFWVIITIIVIEFIAVYSYFGAPWFTDSPVFIILTTFFGVIAIILSILSSSKISLGLSIAYTVLNLLWRLIVFIGSGISY